MFAEGHERVGAMSEDERQELKRLRDLKCWSSVRFIELERKARAEAVDAWRQADVFGEDNPF